MSIDCIPQRTLTPPCGGLARLQAALDHDQQATRPLRQPPARVFGLAGAAALAVIAAIVFWQVIENRPGRIFARHLDAVLNRGNVPGPIRERGILGELPSRNQHVRIVIAEPWPAARAAPSAPR